MSAWLYILANKPGGTLYVGVTNDLVQRVFEHRQGSVEGFTKRYDVKMLVYYEQQRNHSLSDPARKEHQALVARMENRFDRVAQSGMARSLRRDLPLIFDDGSPG